MNTVRLLKLADLLEADAANPEGVKFDLETWALPSNQLDVPSFQRVNSFAPEVTTIPVDCGTAACAFGLAAISGAFKDEGLGYRISSIGNLIPTFGLDENWNASTSFFELDDMDDAYYLFSADNYQAGNRKGQQGEIAVANRIRAFVADGGRPE